MLRSLPEVSQQEVSRGRVKRWGRLPETSLLVAVGLLLVSASYAGGRTAESWAQAAFWVGQLMMFLPVVIRLLSPGLTGDREAFSLVLVLACLCYAAKYCYSPLEFTFPDELQHQRTLQDILTTHHLFAFNYSLPISPRYPGLENVAAAMASLTGTSTFVAGLIIAGAARLLLTVGLYLLFRWISNSARVAGLASVLFTTTFYYKSLLAMFIYMGLAIPFLVLTLIAAVRITSMPPGRVRRVWWVLAVVSIFITVVTHHVSSYLLALMLALACVVFLVSHQTRPKAPCLAMLTVICATFAGLWVVFVAPQTGTYLRPSLINFITGLSGLTSGHTATNGGALQSPLPDQMISYLGVLVIVCCLPIGWRRIWRTQRTNPWALTMMAASTIFYAILALRVVSAKGDEYSGTALAYVFVPVAYVLAVAAEELLVVRRQQLAVASGTMLAGLVLLGGITSGWPPYWERLPGRYLVSGFESSVEPEGVATAQWALSWLYAGNRIAADETNYTLMGTYGQQDTMRGVAELYYSPTFRDADRDLVAQAGIRYVLVDRRLSRQLPASGVYFPDDPLTNRHTRPLPIENLDKFDHVTGILRIYDSGHIVIYDLQGSQYAP
ncbi:MAG: hypothetical protein ACRDSZ_10660 [Pseudonocardiaceae bacterium]